METRSLFMLKGQQKDTIPGLGEQGLVINLFLLPVCAEDIWRRISPANSIWRKLAVFFISTVQLRYI